MLSVLYKGDDYAVPVYSMAIAFVDNGFVARIVRSKREVQERPRAAGYRLLAKVGDARANSDGELKRLFDSGAVEWLETRIEDCPHAAQRVNALRHSKWSVDPDSRWSNIHEKGDPLPIVLHADRVAIGYRNYLQTLAYDGYLNGDEEHVTTALSDLMETLEPCWKPSNAVAPWHREAK